MESERYPIIINGENYLVEETFDGSPGVYRGVSIKHRGHILGPELAKKQYDIFLGEGDVVIIAKRFNKK